MNVAIGEARENEFASGINHFCADASPAGDLFLLPDGDDLSLQDGQTVGPGFFLVDRVDLRVNHDDLGRRVADRLLRTDRARREERQEQKENETADANRLVRSEP